MNSAVSISVLPNSGVFQYGEPDRTKSALCQESGRDTGIPVNPSCLFIFPNLPEADFGLARLSFGSTSIRCARPDVLSIHRTSSLLRAVPLGALTYGLNHDEVPAIWQHISKEGAMQPDYF